ncbi:MAG: cob(I)yrinic acid a,c-diamide adenosyltransferase [Candidatus Odinarchaeia archaeon]
MRNGGGLIITYYGRGDGKTTAAIGHAIRASGQNRKVVIFHFLKGRKNIGEYQFFKRNCENIEVRLCGRPEFYFLGSDPTPFKEEIKKCLDEIAKIIINNGCDMLILDEILYAIEFGLVSEDWLLSVLKNKKDMHIIITGGKITPKIREVSDIVTEMQEVHHHYHHDRETIIGLDY